MYSSKYIETKKSENIIEETNNDAAIVIPFWSEDPNIIFNKKYIFELFPVSYMSFNQKLNSISRLIIFLTIISFIVLQNYKIIIASILTLLAVFLLYKIKKDKYKKRKNEKLSTEEGFNSSDESTSLNESDKTNPAIDYIINKNGSIDDHSIVFDSPSSSNPLSNVLITDYEYNPDKKPAPPSYNEKINDEILEQAKKFVQEANPDQPDIADKLFNNLGDEMCFEQSLRQFNTNPSSTIPNDQAGFADFCYGSMISCKEGNSFACARNLARHQN
jgi:hypothetical protein